LYGSQSLLPFTAIIDLATAIWLSGEKSGFITPAAISGGAYLFQLVPVIWNKPAAVELPCGPGLPGQSGKPFALSL
jgi:hypothetical protein